MARSFGRVLASIWTDGDFCALSGDARLMYIFLLSQPDLDHAGIIPIRLPRWAKMLRLTVAEVEKLIGEMDTARFVVSDAEEGELLVRSLIRRDEIWKQPNVFKSAATSAVACLSERIKGTLLTEIQRLDLSCAGAEVRRVQASLIDELKPFANPSATLGEAFGSASPAPREPSSGAQFEGTGKSSEVLETDDYGQLDEEAGHGGSVTLTEGLAGGTSELRGRGTVVDNPFPLSLSPEPSPIPPTAGAKTARRRLSPEESADRQRHVGEVVAAFADGATEAGMHSPPAALKSRVGKAAKTLLGEDYPIDFLIECAKRLGASGFNDLAVQVRMDDAATNGADQRSQPKDNRRRGGAADPLTDQKYGPGSTDI